MNNCYRRMLQIPWTSHTANDRVRELVANIIGPHDTIATVKKRKLLWFGHVT
jgi:hypothetical protein